MKVKMLSLAVALIFLAMSFAGCGGGNASKDGNNDTSSQGGDTVATSTQEKEKTLEEYSEEMKLTAYQGANYGGPSSAKDTDYAKYVKQRFKINVDEFIWPAGEDVAQRLSTFVASGEMPDVVQAPADAKTLGVFRQMEEAGLLLDVEEYLNKYAPETMRYFTPTILDAYRNPNSNKLFLIPGFTINPDLQGELTVAVNEVLMYREDLLKKAGLEVPKTPDEFYNLLKAFKAMDAPNGKKIIPFSPLWNLSQAYTRFGNQNNIYTHIGAMFGIHKYRTATVDEESRMKDEHETPEYLSYLKFANKLFREGLINLEAYSIEWQKIYNEMAPNGLVGVTVMWPSEIAGISSQLKKVAPEGEYKPMPLPRVDGVGNTEMGYQNTLGTSVIAINKNVADPERLFKYINWLSTREGWATMTWGPPSKDKGTWYISEDGKYIDNPSALTELSKENPKYATDVLGAWAFGLPGILKYTQDLVLDEARPREPIRQMAKEMYDGDMYLNTIFDVFYASPNGPVAKQKKTDLDKIFTEGEAKIIMNSKSDEEVEKAYKSMMDTAAKAGYYDVLKEDYQRYIAIKK